MSVCPICREPDYSAAFGCKACGHVGRAPPARVAPATERRLNIGPMRAMLGFLLLVVFFTVLEIAFFQVIEFLPPGASEFANYYLSIPFIFIAVAMSFFLMNRIMGWHRLKGPSQPLEIDEPEIELPSGVQSREADQAEDKAPVTARLKNLLDDELDD